MQKVRFSLLVRCIVTAKLSGKRPSPFAAMAEPTVCVFNPTSQLKSYFPALEALPEVSAAEREAKRQKKSKKTSTEDQLENDEDDEKAFAAAAADEDEESYISQEEDEEEEEESSSEEESEESEDDRRNAARGALNKRRAVSRKGT